MMILMMMTMMLFVSIFITYIVSGACLCSWEMGFAVFDVDSKLYSNQMLLPSYMEKFCITASVCAVCVKESVVLESMPITVLLNDVQNDRR